MRFSVQLPTDRVNKGDEFLSAEGIAEMARAAEGAGFDACYVTEHPFPTDEWLGSGGHHALDPFVALSAAALATTTLRLHTNILVLGYRNPFLTAKAVASLDVLSGGRVILGVAAGYLEGEFAALGADFSHRNELADEALEAMKRAWSGESVRLGGRGFEAAGNTMLPRPLQRPHPPIWVGGNTKRAMRRAVAHAQGWSPFPIRAAHAGRTRTAGIESVADLAGKIAWMREHAEEARRREPIDVNFVPFGFAMGASAPPDPAALCAQLVELSEIGVSWATVGVPARSRAGYCEAVARFGEEVIQPVRRPRDTRVPGPS